MGLLSTIFNINTKAQIGVLRMDASLNETHTRTAVVTDNEVEDGAIITDHIRLMPKEIKITGTVSDVPVTIFGLGSDKGDILGSAIDFIAGEKPLNEGLARSPSRSPQDAWQYLEQLLDLRTPFSVITGLTAYTNMVLTSLSAPRVAADGRSLNFTATMREIKTVTSSIIQIPSFKLEKGQIANSGQTKANLGKQATNAANEGQESRGSILFETFVR